MDILNEFLKNIFHYFFPNKVIRFNYRQPPWTTDSMKNKPKERPKVTKKYFKGGKKDSTLAQVTALLNKCTKTILKAKEN